MKKLLTTFIIILFFYSCSKDTMFPDDPIDDGIEMPCKKQCVLKLVQVTVNGIHLIKSSSIVIINCSDNGLVFDILKDSKGKIIQYKVYNCN